MRFAADASSAVAGRKAVRSSAIRRGIERFEGDDFRFELTPDGYDALEIKVAFRDLKRQAAARRNPRMPFAEQGAAMPSSVLRPKRRIGIGRGIKRFFVRVHELPTSRQALTAEPAELRNRLQPVERDSTAIRRRWATGPESSERLRRDRSAADRAAASLQNPVSDRIPDRSRRSAALRYNRDAGCGHSRKPDAAVGDRSATGPESSEKGCDATEKGRTRLLPDRQNFSIFDFPCSAFSSEVVIFALRKTPTTP